ncbi:MAG TPA: VOC family protein [Sporosarcina sp.]|nr:VOC family protein [Sporosarcina sp.]
MKFHQKPATYVGDLHLYVADLGRSISFYEEVIGFSVLSLNANKAVLTANGTSALLTIEQPSKVVDKLQTTTGLYHFALLLPTVKDFANILRHFVQLNLKIGAADHLVSEALYLEDPDGNGIEIYVDRDPSTWQWTNGEVAMTTDPLNFNQLLSLTTNKPWAGLPADTVMGHIHLQVANLAESKKFYVDGLGFKVVSYYGNHALFISDAGYHHHIALNTWAGEGIPVGGKDEVGITSYAIYYPTEEMREKAVERLLDLQFWVGEENGEVITYDPSNIQLHLMIATV